MKCMPAKGRKLEFIQLGAGVTSRATLRAGFALLPTHILDYLVQKRLTRRPTEKFSNKKSYTCARLEKNIHLPHTINIIKISLSQMTKIKSLNFVTILLQK